MGFAIYATFHSRAICLWRDMCLRHVSALRAHRGAGIYVRVLSTTFAIGEHIAVLQRKTISRLQSKHIACRRHISLSPAGETPFRKDKAMNKTIKELAVELTIEITAVCDTIKGRAVFLNQLLRSCSSIGANSYEAKYAQSTADFINKLEIALKECYETDYWLEILFKVGSMQESTYKTLSNKCGAIRRKLIASITTAKENG